MIKVHDTDHGCQLLIGAILAQAVEDIPEMKFWAKRKPNGKSTKHNSRVTYSQFELRNLRTFFAGDWVNRLVDLGNLSVDPDMIRQHALKELAKP